MIHWTYEAITLWNEYGLTQMEPLAKQDAYKELKKDSLEH